jgi:hypothetical protein
MVNNISLRPHAATLSYLKHFQVAQFNFHLYIEEGRLQKRQRKTKTASRIT